jgi:hypothetical protein
LDTGTSGYKEGIVELRHAFDNQTHGDESRNPKIDWHGADPLENSAMRSANYIEIESDPTLDADWESKATPIHTRFQPAHHS